MSELRLGPAIRRLREQQRLSLRSLAEKTGFSPSFMSQVENGQASPSISSMERIAGALGTTLGQFFQESAARESTIVKVGTHAGLNSEWSQAHIAYLSPQYAGRPFDAAMITMEPGGMSGKHARPAPNEEFAYVIEGEISLTLNDQDHMLGTRDAVTILATVPRRWNNISDKRAMVLIVSVVPAS